jgi:redox-sensitive bicupin YhaK (pirin superfamily)
MLTIRRADDRGRTKIGWLDSRHSFSFGGYYDREHTGFSVLRVINDDRVDPGAGFPPHGHQNMEIISYVVDGAMAHEDSTGAAAVTRAGEVQRMTAGSGVRHSEFNASETDELRFLQIWIPPQTQGLEPGYEQRKFPLEERRGRLQLLVGPEGQGDALSIHQDARLYGTLLGQGESVAHDIPDGRHVWVQVVRGEVRVNGEQLSEGDGAAISEESRVEFEGVDEAEVIVFDLP